MISSKWKIFRIANFIQLFYSFALLTFIGVTFFEKGFPEISYFILFPVGLFVMMCNSYLNLHILRKYFPGKVPGPDLKSLNTILFIFSILFCLLLAALTVWGSIEEFSHQNLHDYSGKVVLLICVLVLTNWIYILTTQLGMVSMIEKESYNSITETIDSIGRD